MSRAFTREDGWEEPVVPPRAELPPGVPNYVTPRGLALLSQERATLEATRARLDADVPDEDARRTRRTVLTRQLEELAERIASAEVVDPARQARDRARFGARVTLRGLGGAAGGRAGDGAGGGATRAFQVVGVDEADPDAGRISFLAPLARAVLGTAVGERIEFRGERYAVEAIDYEGDAPGAIESPRP